MQVISLGLQDAGGRTYQAEWFTKATTPLPATQTKVDGDLTEEPPYGWKFKKAQPQNGGFGGGKRDPQTEHRITRQHSQDMGIQTLRLGLELGVVKPSEVESVKEIVTMVKTLADVYDRDAWEDRS